MGIGGISIWQLAIILVIVILIFGTKKLKGMGKDLGGAVKGFKDAMDDGKEKDAEEADDKTLGQAEKTSTEDEQKSKVES